MTPTGPVLLHLLLLLPVCLSARYFGHIAENSPVGTPVSGVLLLVGSYLNASLTGDYASDFRLVHHHGHHRDHHVGLVSAKALDREFIAMYELTVQLPRGAAAVQVEVSDRNDNIPQFTGGNRSVEAHALTPLGTELARFDAKDGDAERNGRVTFYALPESHLLHVVPQTGQVRLVRSLLGVRQVTLRLFVRDGGSVALIGDPVFLHINVCRSGKLRKPRALTEDLTYSVSVPEQARLGDLVFTVPDQRFEQRWFQLVSEADSPVQIERDSGRMYLARVLLEPAEVLVKIHNFRGKKPFYLLTP
ncbi:hypothetical protein PBY51_017127 [Eleginops maclovinus]|uniref:Cadherin domain-containing protein n=1 Tax=Eleginops maclovinus TaxID=56733 RepID=A0AAN7XJ48_ELEMC|nr:hypothetical protein PBY51_017127 [Eleginops maclovinus]